MSEELGAIKWRIDVDTTDLGRAETAMDKTGEVAERSGKRVVDSQKRVEKSYKETASAASLALRAAKSLAAGITVAEVVRYADAWKQVNNQLRQIVGSEAELRAVRTQLLGISKGTNAELRVTAGLYAEMYRATRDLGTSQQTVADVTRTINNLFKAGGKSASETAGAVRQLTQGLAAGALRGDEFNSVAEGAPRILDALAKHLNMARGDLRDFAATGGITAEILIGALESYGEEAQRMADLTEETFGQKLVNAKTNAIEFAGQAEILSGAVNLAGDSIEALSEHLDTVTTLAAGLALVMGGRLAGSALAAGGSFLYATTQAMGYQAALARMAGVSVTAAASQTLLSRSLMLVGGAGGGFVLASGAAIYLATSLETVEERAARAEAALNSLTQEQLRSAIDALKVERDSAEATILRMEETSKGYAAQTRAIDIQKKRLEDINARLRAYGLRLSDLTNGIDRNTEATNDNAAATARLTEEQQRAGRTIAEQIAGMRTELVQTQMTDRQRAISEALIKATNTAQEAGIALTAAQTTAIVENAAALYDQQAAIEAKADAEKQAAEEAKDLAAEQAAQQKRHIEGVARAHEQAMQRADDDVRAFRDSFSDYLADMAMQNENITEVIADAWKRMGFKIIGDLAASGFLSLLNGRGGGSGLFGGSGAGGAGGIESLFANAGVAGSIFSRLGGGEYLARVATGGQATITNAEFEQLMGGKSTSTGFNVTDLKNIGISIGAGIAGSMAGTHLGESLFGKEAESNWGATVGGLIGAMSGPLGSFIGSALGGIVDAAFGGDGRQRANAGFLAGPTPGLKQEYNAGSHTFASGLRVTLFSRRTDPAAARDIAEVFDQVDRSFVDLVEELGGAIDMTGKSLRGLDEEATPGSVGTLFGTGGNGTTQGDIAAQLASYLGQLAENVTGLESALVDSIKAATSAEEVLQLLTQAVIDKAAEEKKEKESAETAAAVLREKIGLQDRLDELTMTSVQLLQKQRNALDESNRALFDQIQSLEAMAAVVKAEASVASAQSGVRAALRAVGDEVRALGDELNDAASDVEKAQERINDLNREAAERLRVFGKSIDEFLETISPSTRMGLTGLKNQLAATSALAMEGDTTAQSKLIAQAQAVLKAAEASSSTRADFLRVEAFVRSTLLSVRDEIVPPPEEEGEETTALEKAEKELEDAMTARTAAQNAYSQALALTSNLTLTQAGTLSGLMSALAGLGAANSELTAAQAALAAAQEAAGETATGAANAFKLTRDEANALATVLGLTGTAAQTLIDSLMDPTQAVNAFATALSGMTPEQISAFLGQIEPEQIASFMGKITDAQISAFLGRITPDQAAAFLGQLTPEQIEQFMGAITPQQIADFLGNVTPEQVAAFLGSLSQDQANAFMGTQIMGMFAGANATLIAGINAMLTGAANDFTYYTSKQIRDHKAAGGTDFDTVTEIYNEAVRRNADPIAVGAALGYTAAETVRMLRDANIPGYKTGTNAIEEDHLAWFTEGEEVKPKPYVDLERAERAETNALLRDLLKKTDSQNDTLGKVLTASKESAKYSEDTNNLLIRVINGEMPLFVRDAA